MSQSCCVPLSNAGITAMCSNFLEARENILRNKSSLPVSHSVGMGEVAHGNKLHRNCTVLTGCATAQVPKVETRDRLPSMNACTVLSTQLSKCCKTRMISLLLLLGTIARTAFIFSFMFSKVPPRASTVLDCKSKMNPDESFWLCFLDIAVFSRSRGKKRRKYLCPSSGTPANLKVGNRSL